MIEFNVEEITENDLIEAANKIFSAEEKDFEKIKSEKWYQTFFHAITFNQDGKKYTVKGVHSLAKLQQLFMTIYVKNYKKTHSQINEIIDALTKNSEAIKKLYGACVLKIEEQTSLAELDEYDAKILAWFLGQYRNADGDVPDNVKKYNHGVLNALSQKVPEKMEYDNQIEKLKNPKVVYRCFIEQSAIDSTIATREWTDDIYNYLDDFAISPKSKKQIEESVKYEVDIAGIDYLITKYTKYDMGIAVTDFLFEIESSTNQKIYKQKNDYIKFGLKKINKSLTDLEEKLLSKNSSSPKYIEIEVLSENEIYEEIVKGNIRLPILIESIKRSFDHENGFVKAFRFYKKNYPYHFSNSEEKKYYFFIATIDGLFFFVDGNIAFVEYGSVISVNKDFSISVDKTEWYKEYGACISGENEIEISKILSAEKYLTILRKGIENIIELTGGYVESKYDKIEKIVKRYIKLIPKSSSAKAYLVNEFHYDDYEKNMNRLRNALSKYALKVRKDEVIGFIDKSFFNDGGDGLLFSKHGIAFDYAFEKVFIRYEEIKSMNIKEEFLYGKYLVFHGHFSERKDDTNNPSINDIYFDLYRLKDCLEEIMYSIT